MTDGSLEAARMITDLVARQLGELQEAREHGDAHPITREAARKLAITVPLARTALGDLLPAVLRMGGGRRG